MPVIGELTICHVVYSDMLMEVLSILVNTATPFSVEGVDLNRNMVVIKATYNTLYGYHKSAMENVNHLLAEYGEFRYGTGNADFVDRTEPKK